MAYPEIPKNKTIDDNIVFLTELNKYKEFKVLTPSSKKCNITLNGFIDTNYVNTKMYLHNAQLFVQRFLNPLTPYKRLLLNWQTGTGKTIAAISIANVFIQEMSISTTPTVFIIGFTKSIIQAEMLSKPELGYITHTELSVLKKYQKTANEYPTKDNTRMLYNYTSNLKRRLVDKAKGGNFKFYGYKEFVYALFLVTDLGKRNKFSLSAIFDINIDLNKNTSFFIEQLIIAERNQYIIINKELLLLLKYNLIIADEIHNVYNTQERNNYGIALQYVLDVYDKGSPYVVFMSATPVTGSPIEFIDLINLLVPKEYLPNCRPLTKKEMLTNDLKWKPHALETISRLTLGRVSFLYDYNNKEDYPTRIIDGEQLSYDGNVLPYLKFIKCPMSEYHEDTIDNFVLDKNNIKILVNQQTIYDMVFPSTLKYGNFVSKITQADILNATPEWRKKNKINIIKNSSNVRVISGDFLKEENIGKYSAKYHRLLTDIIDIIKSGPGKILIYHNRVKMSGILLISEMLKCNGFTDNVTIYNENTLCGICGIIYSKHDESEHTYNPAAFVVIYSDMTHTEKSYSLNTFNEPSNAYGEKVRIMIGSHVIAEGLNFNCIAYELIMSVPVNISSLLQIFGRAIRKKSHSLLPKKNNNVHIRLYVSTKNKKDIELDLLKYFIKLRVYTVIQQGNLAMHKYTIDSCINTYDIPKANIDYLKTTPALNTVPDDTYTSSYDIYKYNNVEINVITEILIDLFAVRPVWKYTDLIETIKCDKKTNYNISMFNTNNIDIAINNMLGQITNIGDYYILCDNELDIESFLREKPVIETKVVLNDYIRNTSKKKTFEDRYNILKLVDNDIYKLIYYNDSLFHLELIKKLIKESRSDNFDSTDKFLEMYLNYDIIIQYKHIDKYNKSIRNLFDTPVDYVGYIYLSYIYIYSKDKWFKISYIKPNIVENNTIVGYMVEKENKFVFKIRQPLHFIKKENIKDLRYIERGAMCETKTKSYQEFILKRLTAGDILKNTSDNCELIRNILLLNEYNKKDGVKWFYLFNENIPKFNIEY